MTIGKEKDISPLNISNKMKICEVYSIYRQNTSWNASNWINSEN